MPQVQKEYIKELVEKTTPAQNTLEPLIQSLMMEVRQLKEKDQPSYKQIIDQTHSRIEENKLRDDYLEMKLLNEQLKRNLDDEKDKNKKLERKVEKLEDKLSTIHTDHAKDKEKMISEYKEIIKEPQQIDDNRDLIFQLQ